MFKKRSKTIAKLSALFGGKKNKKKGNSVSHSTTRPQKPDLSQAAILEAIERGDMD